MITIDRVMAWQPCPQYSRDRLLELSGGRESMTPLEICDLNIPPQDILWLLLREEIIPAAELHELACKYAESAVHLCGDDPRPRAAISAKRAWLRGEISGDQLASAGAAAWSAWASAGAAAWVAWTAAREPQISMVRDVLKKLTGYAEGATETPNA